MSTKPKTVKYIGNARSVVRSLTEVLNEKETIKDAQAIADQWNVELLHRATEEVLAQMRANRSGTIMRPIPENESRKPYGWGDLWE